MSIYDFRDRPAYERLKVERHYAENKHILKWWTPDHDKILAQQITQMQWVWYWNISDKIAAVTAPARLEAWKKNDPLCSQYAWYNVLMYFAAARAQQLGLTKAIRQPKWKTCPLCEQEFIESSLPLPLIERLGGIDKLDFCSPCLSSNLVDSGNGRASKATVVKYLQDLTALIGRVPTQNIGEGVTDLHDIDCEERVALLRLRMTRPSTKRIKLVFGSWLNALIQAGILEDGTRKTSRGIQSIAKDGHVCLSLGEKTIDDFLHARGIRHEKEPKYPKGNYRGDFTVDGVIIEYFGLAGDPDYDAKIKEKTRICKKNGITLIAIYPQDLISRKKLEDKLSSVLHRSADAKVVTLHLPNKTSALT